MVTVSKWLAYPLVLLGLMGGAGTGTARAQLSTDPAPRLVAFELFTRFT